MPCIWWQVRLAELEKGLLEALATAEGDLLEDTSLIDRLSETKATAAEIQVRSTLCLSVIPCAALVLLL